MFNPVTVVIDAFIDDLDQRYRAAFPAVPDSHACALAGTARTLLETLANCDAPYHDINHTLMVTVVGQEILNGRLVARGDLTADDWLHAVVSMLCHDIGYVRGVCRADRGGAYDGCTGGEPILPDPGATDAALSAWHVDRGKQFVRERFGSHPLLNAERLANNIERTRFPVPDAAGYQAQDDEAGLVRAADLIGQLGDPQYILKLSRLYQEFQETGAAKAMNYSSAAEVRSGYPRFFWTMVSPYIQEALRLLRRTQSGQEWVARLYAHVFVEEHEAPAYGPERRQVAERRMTPVDVAPGINRRMASYGRRSEDTAGDSTAAAPVADSNNGDRRSST